MEYYVQKVLKKLGAENLAYHCNFRGKLYLVYHSLNPQDNAPITVALPAKDGFPLTIIKGYLSEAEVTKELAGS